MMIHGKTKYLLNHIKLNSEFQKSPSQRPWLVGKTSREIFLLLAIHPFYLRSI